MKFFSQKKYLIFSVGFFILSVLVFFFLYRVIGKKEEISETVQTKLQEEIIREENEKSLSNSIKEIAPERALLEKHFVQSSDIVPFLDTIEKIAETVQVKAEISSVEIEKNVPSLIVEIKAQGGFENIYKLITLLENSPYNLEFILVDIKNSDNLVGKVPQWTAALRLRLLSFSI